MPSPGSSEQHLREALAAIVEGRAVKRVRHELTYAGADLTPIFIHELERQGYLPTTVGGVDVKPGERIPAFRIEGNVAYFGWVFWEQFTSWKLRKLWGSIIKNDRGDWDIQIPAGKDAVIYANGQLKLEMDIDHPPEF